MSAGGVQSMWVQYAISLWVGCYSMSHGCLNCPSRLLRLRKKQDPGVIIKGTVSEWFKVRHMCRDSLVLLCPESDFFILEAEKWLQEAFDMIVSRPDLTFIALTKRLERAKMFLPEAALPNLWLGCSAEDQRTTEERVSLMYSIPAAGYVISLQPLLAPVNLSQFLKHPLLKKVVVGCEMGPKSRVRYCDNKWLINVFQQCQEHDVSCFITRHREGNQLITNGAEDGRGSHNPMNTTYRSSMTDLEA